MDQLLRRRLGGEIFQDLAVQSSRAQAQYYEAHLRAGQRHGRVGANQRPVNTYVLRPSQITAQAAVDGLCVSRHIGSPDADRYCRQSDGLQAPLRSAEYSYRNQSHRPRQLVQIHSRR